MKISILTLLFAFAILTSGCNKEEMPDKLIVGQWNLEVAERQVNGTSDKKVVPNSVAVIVEFNKKNEFNETYKNTIPVNYGFLGCGGGSYELEGENAVRIRATCMSSLSGRVFVISALTKNQLILADEFGSKFTFKR